MESTSAVTFAGQRNSYIARTDAYDVSHRQVRREDNLTIPIIAYSALAMIAAAFIGLGAASLLPYSFVYVGSVFLGLSSIYLALSVYFKYSEGKESKPEPLENVPIRSCQCRDIPIDHSQVEDPEREPVEDVAVELERVPVVEHRREIGIQELPITGAIIDQIIEFVGDDTYTINSLNGLSEDPFWLSDYVQEPHHQELVETHDKEAGYVDRIFRSINTNLRVPHPIHIPPVDIFKSVDKVLSYPVFPLFNSTDFKASIIRGFRHSWEEAQFDAANNPEGAIIRAFEEADARAFRSDMHTLDPIDYEIDIEYRIPENKYISFYGKITTSQHTVPFLLLFKWGGVRWDIIYSEQDSSILEGDLQSSIGHDRQITMEQLRRNKKVWSVLLYESSKSSHIGPWLTGLIQGKLSPYICFKTRENLSSMERDIDEPMRDPIQAEFISGATMQICAPGDPATHSPWRDLEPWYDRVRIQEEE